MPADSPLLDYATPPPRRPQGSALRRLGFVLFVANVLVAGLGLLVAFSD